ncbi:MAG TPA: TRAP transporter small permease [Dehalococcoidales bacterium]|nr:TRAP transporter small permease [Dehalococcoidales bacterium]
MDQSAGEGKKTPPSGILSKIIYYLSKIIDPIGTAGSLVAALALFLMMILTFADVTLTRIGKMSGSFSIFRPIIGSQEVQELFMIVLVSFGLAYMALKKGHIRVDLVLQYVSYKAKNWFDIFTYLLSMVFYIFIARQAWLMAFDNIQDEAVSTILNVPLYPLNFVLFAGAFLVVLMFLRDLLQSVEGVIRSWNR